MWSSITWLQAASGWCLWVGGVAGAIAALAGLFSGVTANRALDLQTRAHELKLTELRVVIATLEKETAEAKRDVRFATTLGILGLS